MADSCCGANVRFDGLDPRYRRVLWTVIAINAVMFVVEITAGHIAGSQALQADALDFFGDTLTYGLSLAVIGRSIQTRSYAAMLKGVSLTLMGLWVFGSTPTMCWSWAFRAPRSWASSACWPWPPTSPVYCC